MKKLLLVAAWLSATTMTLVSAFIIERHVDLAKTQTIIDSQNVQPVLAQPSYNLYTALPDVVSDVAQIVASGDARPLILQKYLSLQNAPLAQYAQKLVDTSDKYSLDWRLLTAIAMQESNGGKVIPQDSYNAWGWAIYGSTTKRFENWEHAIEIVASGLKANYIDRGLVTPDQIMAKYTPPSLEKGGSWAKGINYFLNLLQ